MGAGEEYEAALAEKAAIAARCVQERKYLAAHHRIGESIGRSRAWCLLQFASYVSLAWICVAATRLIFADGQAYPAKIDAFRKPFDLANSGLFRLCRACRRGYR